MSKMELKFLFNSSVSVYLFLSFVFSFIFISWKTSKPDKQQQKLPPGPWKLPFIGSLHHLVGSLPHHSLRKLSIKYGPLMHLQLGEISAVVISSPELAKAVTKTHDLAFASRPKLMLLEIAFYKCTDIAFSPYGDYWRQMRRICTLELLSAKMVKSFGSIRQEELSKVMLSIMSSSEAGCPINLTEKISWFTSSMICRAAFGKLISRDHVDKYIVIVKDMVELAAGFEVADLFPSKKWIHYLSRTKSRLLKLHKELDQIFEVIISDHIQKKLANGNNDVGEEDLVDVLLRVMENGELQFPITRDNIKGVINDIFSAGTETSATVIMWALSEMIKRPSVMVKAQAEVRQTLKGKKIFDDKDIEKLTYLNLVIKETLRLHPPFPFILPRECIQETQIDECIISPKTRVMINVWALGRDPEIWKDSNKFLPERFENSSVDFTGNHYELIPFGAGRRICPGISFGLANVVHSLACLLYHFDWELPAGVSLDDLDMSETVGIIAARKDDLYLIPRPKNSLSTE